MGCCSTAWRCPCVRCQLFARRGSLGRVANKQAPNGDSQAARGVGASYGLARCGCFRADRFGSGRMGGAVLRFAGDLKRPATSSTPGCPVRTRGVQSGIVLAVSLRRTPRHALRQTDRRLPPAPGLAAAGSAAPAPVPGRMHLPQVRRCGHGPRRGRLPVADPHAYAYGYTDIVAHVDAYTDVVAHIDPRPRGCDRPHRRPP